MKKHNYLLLAALIISGQVHAFHVGTDFKVKTFDRQPIVVSFDNRIFAEPVTELRITDLAPGAHHLTVWSVQPGNRFGHGSRRLLYRGWVDLPEAHRVGSVINHRNELRITHLEPKFNPVPLPAPVHYPNAPVLSPLCQADFDALYEVIARRSFDSTRLMLAKDAVSRNLMTSRQIAELVNLLSFDSSRLELAKYAYAGVYDPQNYFLLFDYFTFDSSVEALSRHIGYRS